MTNYSFVLDDSGNKLSPTKEEKAWYMIRKGRAKLISKYPLVIKINKNIPKDEICKDEIRCGIDDGLHTGISLVQKCKTKNKVIFKGVIEQRKDVKRLMDIRRGYRKYHRSNKRYRKERFYNRKASRRKNRIAPSILQKRQATIRVINKLNKWVNINNYWLEDIAINIKALSYDYVQYKWNNENEVRLDENIRKAVIFRDGCKCKECGAKNVKLEIHHIKPRRLNGSNLLTNLITLCKKCHQKTKGKEEQYMNYYFNLIDSSGDNKYINCASYVMIGKNWLRKELSKLGKLNITNGGDTANKRIDWNIEKTHSNDAICITDLQPDTTNIKEWIIKPIRRKSKAINDNVLGIKHKDLVKYTFKNGETHIGYVVALFPKLNALSFKSNIKYCRKVNAKKCKLLWRYSKIYWLDNVV